MASLPPIRTLDSNLEDRTTIILGVVTVRILERATGQIPTAITISMTAPVPAIDTGHHLHHPSDPYLPATTFLSPVCPHHTIVEQLVLVEMCHMIVRTTTTTITNIVETLKTTEIVIFILEMEIS